LKTLDFLLPFGQLTRVTPISYIAAIYTQPGLSFDSFRQSPKSYLFSDWSA